MMKGAVDEGSGYPTTAAEASELARPEQQQQEPQRRQSSSLETQVRGKPASNGNNNSRRKGNESGGNDNYDDIISSTRDDGLSDANWREDGGGSGDDDDVAVLAKVAEFTHPGQYVFFALVSRSWRDGWKKTRRPAATTYIALAASSGSPNSSTAAAGDFVRLTRGVRGADIGEQSTQAERESASTPSPTSKQFYALLEP